MDERNGRPVSRDLWYEAHNNLVERVRKLEQWTDDYERGERERIREAAAERRQRTWSLILAILCSLFLPLLVSLVIALAGK